MMSGSGFDMSLLGGFGMAWLGLVILFFVFAFSKRWVFEELLQTPFNLWTAFGACAIVYFITANLMCSPRFAFVFGLIAGAAGGYFGGMFFEQG